MDRDSSVLWGLCNRSLILMYSLMDEPLSNLDAKLRVQMRSEISALHHRLGATIIYVTHDQTEAMTLGTRIVVLKDGVTSRLILLRNYTMSRITYSLQASLAPRR